MKVVSASDAINELSRIGVLADAHVVEPFLPYQLCKSNDCTTDVQLIGCKFDAIKAGGMRFMKPVVIDNCVINRSDFVFTYFLQGLSISGSTFVSEVNFESGGHNCAGFPIRIVETVFEDFVNFFDCMYDGPVAVTACTFKKGTNLLGNKDKETRVRFEIPPTISGNVGQVDVEGEGAA